MSRKFFFVFLLMFSFQSLFSSFSFGSSQRSRVEAWELGSLRDHKVIRKMDSLLARIKNLTSHGFIFHQTVKPSSRKYDGCHHIISKQIMAYLPDMMTEDQILKMSEALGVYLGGRTWKESLALFLIHTKTNMIYPYASYRDKPSEDLYISSKLRVDDPGPGFDFIPKWDGKRLCYTLTEASYLLLDILLIVDRFVERLVQSDFCTTEGIFSEKEFSLLLSYFKRLLEISPDGEAHRIAFRKGKKGFFMDPTLDHEKRSISRKKKKILRKNSY